MTLELLKVGPVSTTHYTLHTTHYNVITGTWSKTLVNVRGLGKIVKKFVSKQTGTSVLCLKTLTLIVRFVYNWKKHTNEWLVGQIDGGDKRGQSWWSCKYFQVGKDITHTHTHAPLIPNQTLCLDMQNRESFPRVLTELETHRAQMETSPRDRTFSH